jgi:hypothetical protein
VRKREGERSKSDGNIGTVAVEHRGGGVDDGFG